LTLETVTLLTAVTLTLLTAGLLLWLWRRSAAVFQPDPQRDTRWLRFLAALATVGYGQYLLATAEPVYGPFAWAAALNGRWRFDLLNLDNVLVGVPLLLIGAALFSGAARYAPWEAAEEELSAWPVWRRWRWGEWLAALLLLAGTAVLLVMRDIGWLPVTLWLAALLLLARQFWLHDRQAGQDLSLHLTRTDAAWLLILLLAGILIGAAYLQDIPARMIGDEGSFWEAARAIASGEHSPSFFDLGVYTFPMAGSYWQAAVLRLFGLNLWSWRFASVLAGVLAVIPLYVLGREWFGRGTAVFAGFIMITSPYFLAFARLGYNNSQALLPVTLAVAFAWLGLRRSSLFYVWLAGMAAGWGFYTYTAARLGLIILVLLLLLLWLRRDVTWRRALSLLVVLGLAWAVVVLPFWVFGALNPDKAEPYKFWESLFFNVFYGRAFFSDAELFRFAGPLRIGYQELFFQPVIYARLLLRGVVRSLLAFHSPFFGGEEHFVATGLAGGLLPGTFFVLGGALVLRGWRRLRFALPLLWFAAGLLFLSVANTLPPRHTHLVAVIPVAALLAAVGVTAFTAVLAESLAHNVTAVAAVWWRRAATVLCLAGIVWAGVTHYFGPLASQYPANFEQLVAWTAVRLQAVSSKHLVLVETTPQHHDVAYMLWAKMLALPYENFPSEAVLAGEPSALNGEAVLAFIPAQEATAVVTAVSQMVPNAWAPVTLSGPRGELWGYVVGNMPLPVPPDLSVIGGVQSAAASPAGPAIGLLLLLLLILGVRTVQTTGPVQVRFTRRSGREVRPNEEKAGEDEAYARYHVGFDLEISVKRREE